MIRHRFRLPQMEKVREKAFILQLEKGKSKGKRKRKKKKKKKKQEKRRERERKDSSFFHLSVFRLERLHHTHSHTSLSLWRRSFFYLINYTHTLSLSLSLWFSRPSLKVSEGAPNNTVSSTLSHTYIFLVNCSSNFQWQYILMLNC